MFSKLPRLAVNWQQQPEMLRRYWDQAMIAVEFLMGVNPVEVAKLPSDPTYRRTFVKDSSVTTFGSVVVGGGINIVPVYYDGTNWRVG